MSAILNVSLVSRTLAATRRWARPLLALVCLGGALGVAHLNTRAELAAAQATAARLSAELTALRAELSALKAELNGAEKRLVPLPSRGR